MKFTPTERFWSEEFKSWYVPGLTYTVRHPKSRLAGVAETWLKQGKIREVSGQASIQGSDKPKSLLERLFPWL